MRGAAWIAGLLCCLGGCAPLEQERVRDYAEDGVYLFKRGDYANARESFQAALALQPNDPALLYNLGRCYERQGDFAKAERQYQACLERNPDHAECRHALAALLVRDGRGADATRMVKGWLASSPKLAAAHAEDGWLWFQAGDLPRAQAHLQEALELDPHDTRALLELAHVYEALQRPDRAYVLYERVLEQDPHRPEVIDRLNRLRAQGAGRPRPDD
jgi:Flp pilus assembly protein TadD